MDKSNQTTRRFSSSSNEDVNTRHLKRSSFLAQIPDIVSNFRCSCCRIYRINRTMGRRRPIFLIKRHMPQGEGWWPRPGSNRRHTDFQSVALPTELPSHVQDLFWRNGRGAGIRTLDPVIKSHLLYQLSYAPIHQCLHWSEERDSNPRQPPWQGGTLPTELSSHRENGA